MSGDTTTYQRLARQFPTEAHKTLAARGGQTYVPWNLVAERLNEELTVTGWSFEVIREGFTTNECWVLGRLTATIDGETTFRDQYGCADIMLGQSPNTDLLKKAGTDALKKCAQVLGVALYLTDADDRAEVQAAMREANRPTPFGAATPAASPGIQASRSASTPTAGAAPTSSSTTDIAAQAGAAPVNQQQRWQRLVAEAERVKLPTLGTVKAIDPKACGESQLKRHADRLEARLYEIREQGAA